MVFEIFAKPLGETPVKIGTGFSEKDANNRLNELNLSAGLTYRFFKRIEG